jgi:SAM-dependent MidA family methyltransferase
MASLPIPSHAAQTHSAELVSLIQHTIVQKGGWIDFATFMQMALYAPLLGYYSGGAKKFGVGGDFVTAPEISPLFAQSLANQVAQVLVETGGSVLELGAGTGKLASDLILALAAKNQLPEQYCILEISDYLREVQHDYLKHSLPDDLFTRVTWIEKLPEAFVGVMLGNEVLDAIPVHLIYKRDGQLYERGVAWDVGLIWQDRPLIDSELIRHVSALQMHDDYLTEVNLASVGLINSLTESLKQGLVLMLDYGFGEPEYYHPQRKQGTLMCHYQHYAHSNPLINVGLQDITAHVNFTAIAEAGFDNGFDVAYVNQASFLMNCGLLDILAKTSPEDMASYVPLAASAQKLLSPAEMGELFKVIAFSKGVNKPLIGFIQGDKRHTL